jgi:hypothetical protein
MNTHPYLRAYMAGIVAPSVALLLGLSIFILMRLVFQISIPIERVIIFPMAVIPSAFGIWNILYVWSRPHRGLPIGLHGAMLPVILVTIGAVFAAYSGLMVIGTQRVTWFQVFSIPYSLIAVWFIGAMVLYYLVWKYVVGFLNQILGVA